tara:strand:- start:328 stop:1377 length:1050 start_codon:yes stop_codon:yes gene_type:complete
MNEKQKIEEIDLIKSFSYFVRIIKKIFSIIINIFIVFANLFIQLFLLVRKKYLLFLTSIIVGVLLGFFYGNINGICYKTTLTVSPQYGSVQQLYKNIEYYQTLVNEKDYDELQSNLNLNLNEAKSILYLSVRPFKSEMIDLKIYRRLLDLADSVTRIGFNYENYKNKLSYEDYNTHVISLTLDTVLVPDELANSLVNSISKNEFYKSRQALALKNLEEERALINISIGKLDSLIFQNQEQTGDSKDKTLGTQIYMDDNQNQEVYSTLFSYYPRFNNNLLEINTELNTNKNIINIISDFSKSAKKESFTNYIFPVSLLCFSFTLFLMMIFNTIQFINKNPNFKFKKLNSK